MPDSGVILGQTFNLPFDNIDTDQIFPGRYLTTTSRDGLGAFCFYDWRHDCTAGKQLFFKHYNPGAQTILVCGDNFGCGSSREHAAWALLDFGIRAVISTRFADIFKSNAEMNGLLLITVEQTVLDFLLARDSQWLTVDISAKKLVIPGFGNVRFSLDEFASYCLLHGIDAMGFLLNQANEIAVFEKSRTGQTAG